MKSLIKFAAILIIVLLSNCISMKLVDPSKRIHSSYEENYTGSIFGFSFGGGNMLCEHGLQEVQIERPFWAGFIFEFYGLLPLYINFRKTIAVCADGGDGLSSSSGSGNFNDIVSLKNGEIITGVKAAVTGDSVVVTTKKGAVSVYKKKDVAGVKRQ
ncbi:hypothetical protein CH370_06110 [Leptospira kmetyi]|uniref:hypothetical protein n=1 Tax=Leptospira kmetyi TaxID=408139 RepID=UPI000C2AB6CD|nr:hypothetical protein [Leptospira kmetyi]PJZ42774.1 hypothetical protein CH370_06110 [Leptospira kmetyi]